MSPKRVALAGLIALALGCGDGSVESAHEQRVHEVAQAGAGVMPFDLERSTHLFTEAPWGGEQQVVSDDQDPAQIERIRSHLAEEAARFGHGDFASPERIHGRDMPGLALLRERHADLQVSYADLPAGGSITYRAADPGVIAAIHAWFAAQRSDHGAHAAH